MFERRLRLCLKNALKRDNVPVVVVVLIVKSAVFV
jgi:hypothetical protein